MLEGDGTANPAHSDSGTSRLAGEASASLRIPIGNVYAWPERAIFTLGTHSYSHCLMLDGCSVNCDLFMLFVRIG